MDGAGVSIVQGSEICRLLSSPMLSQSKNES